MISIKTKRFQYSIAENGRNLEFTDLRTGENAAAASYCAVLTDADKKQHYPVSVKMPDSVLHIAFDNGISISVQTETRSDYALFTLQAVSCEDFFSVAFVNIETSIRYDEHLYRESDLFTASLMGMTVSTRMAEHPGRNTVLRAEAYPHIGLLSTKRSPYPARAAVIGAADCDIRAIMKEVMQEIPEGELPKSERGGPWAYDCKDARRTYTTLSGVRLEEVDGIVERLRKFGISQVGIHQGVPYRQGDFEVNRELYPNGLPDFKAVIDRFHSHGFQVGLHPYTFFVDHNSRYLTPVPHEELDYICELTLDDEIDEKQEEIRFAEAPDQVAEVYNYSLVSSPYLKIGKELVKFNGLRKEPPYAFLNCERGALGTRVSAHHAGERIRQLKEYFLFVAPQANSDLFYEVARNTAEFYNECGFDMMYLDAIDGVFCLDGNDYAWYHAAAFIAEMFRHIRKPPIFDCCYNPQYTASWYARSRYGALDSGNKGYTAYIDAHINYNNRTAERMYMPQELGWWDLYNGNAKYGTQARIMTPEDVEYLCSRIIGTDCCMSYRRMSVLTEKPYLDRYADMIRMYDEVRRKGNLPHELKRLLREPEKHFTLQQGPDGEYVFHSAAVKRYRVDSFEDARNTFYVRNHFRNQLPFIRIEPLCAAADYDDPNAVTLKEFDENVPIAKDETYELDTDAPVDGCGNTALGVWLYGDGSGTTVRIRLANRLVDVPRNQADYYIKADFVGWRYFAFTESQNAEPDISDWPRTEMVYRVFRDVRFFYDAYRNPVDYSKISFLRITTNSDKPTQIRIRTLKLLPSFENRLENPSLTVNGKTLTFHTSLSCFSCLEYDPSGACTVYDYDGNVLGHPSVSGVPGELVDHLNNAVTLDSEDMPQHQKRAAVTVKLVGGPALKEKQHTAEVRQSDIEKALREVGIDAGDLLLVHSSFSRLGHVEGGAAAVITALETVLGTEGTLVMPALIQHDFARAYETWDINKPSDVGYLTEYFRKLPGVLRSDQATHSVTARGRLAHELTHEHTARGPRPGPFGEYAFSESSPWQKLYDINGKVLFIGVTMRKNTLKHLIESMLVEYLLNGITDENRRQEMMKCLKGFGKAGVWPYFDNERMQAELETAGFIRESVCGNAVFRCTEIAPMVDYSLEKLKAEPSEWYSGDALAWIEECERWRVTE